MELTNGWHPEIDDETYHSKEFGAIGSSSLKHYLRSASHGKNEQEKESDSDVRFGTLVHSMLLDPSEFARYCVAPICDRRTKEGKAMYASFLAGLPDKAKIVKNEEMQQALSIKQVIEKHETYNALLSGGTAEVAGTYYDKELGVWLKIKPDYKHKDNILFDIKTTDDARLQNFDRQILKLGYDLQAAYYLDVANLIEGSRRYNKFIWVVIETAPPHGVCFYEVSNEWIELGREKYLLALKAYAEAKATGVYPTYTNKIIVATPPAYAMYT